MIHPFDAQFFLGYINHVNPQYVRVHFPSSVLLNRNFLAGEEYNGGLVGSFVTIEGENAGFIGKITELDLPEKERLSLSEKAFQSADFHPTARVQILLSFDYYNSKVALRSLNSFPNIGAKVFVCPSGFIQQYVMSFGKKDDTDNLFLDIGALTSNPDTRVTLSQQALFGRHCAVVGTTGGGKSWTVSKMIEGVKRNHSKVILIDPTGEYSTLVSSPDVRSVQFGVDTFFSYRDLTIEDLFFLVKPAAKTQVPKLVEAVRSLKCIDAGIGKDLYFSEFIENGLLKKQRMNIKQYERFCLINQNKIESPTLSFDIRNLDKQIVNECVYINNDVYGAQNDNDLSYCYSMISRITNFKRTGIISSMFGMDDQVEDNNLIRIVDSFLEQEQKDKLVLRIGFEEVGFEFQAREIAANAIGKYLLGKARNGAFKSFPLLLVLDEAHQFLNKSVVDDYFESQNLSAFDQIAKECRKYGLFLCIATQMPKDIPLGTLSQMGTFIVHRLINYNDKEAVKQACSSADNDVLSFLPVLGAGEAIISGVDFPMSLTVKIDKPSIPPDSQTPTFKDITKIKTKTGIVSP